MRLFNSLTGKKEQFEPMGDVVTIYSCGPTVYGAPHIGNARASFVADLLRRSLVFLGYDVKFVSNFTDIDDKMINAAGERGITVQELADEMSDIAKRSFAALRINEPDVRPYATEYIDEMFVMLKELLNKGYLYEIEGDGLYFRIDMFEEYGKLSKQNLDELNVGERIEENSGKENPRDFVVWKYKKEGEPAWTDAEGVIKEGRPGWHIECSAMIKGILGDTIDIHMGGMDLKFPHHECEIAQSECAHGKPLANFWVHNGFINMSGEKMSKSLGNIKSVIDLIKVYDPLDIRYFLMSVHYRSPLDFNDQNIKQAIQSRARIQNLWDRLCEITTYGLYDGSNLGHCNALYLSFSEAIKNDLNISQALSDLFEFINSVNRILDSHSLTFEYVDLLKKTLIKIDKVLGVLRTEKTELSVEQKELFDKRVIARENKDYEESDRLRDELLALGVQVLDSAEGSTYRVIV
jgi:cysteinyl-tRNA synthetase